MNTLKLYDDGHLFEFDAEVISCENKNGDYLTVLNQTAFFPEGGGQYGDTGTINGVEIFDTQIENGIIYHYSRSPVEIGNAHCVLDKEKRFRRMQNHSGEHIVSGIVHRLYGYDNVGFHLGDDDVTLDFNGELTREQLIEVEKLANEAIYKNVTFCIDYPDSQTLEALDYRSKLDLKDDVRIVTVDGYDVCACCAPHVSSSGEIGIIKVLDSERHRGGTRLHILCGLSALDDYNIKCNNLEEISVRLCSKRNEAAQVFSKFADDAEQLKQEIASLRREITKLKSEEFEDTDENIVIFEENLAMPDLRKLVLSAVKHTKGICAGFSGNDSNGYTFAIASENINLLEIQNDIKDSISGRGGGSKELIQGSCTANKKEIENYFKNTAQI